MNVNGQKKIPEWIGQTTNVPKAVAFPSGAGAVRYGSSEICPCADFPNEAWLKQYLNRCLFEIRLDWVTVEHHMRLMLRNSMHSTATDSCNVITEQHFLLMNIYSLAKWKLKWVKFYTQLCIDFPYEKDKKHICAYRH